MTSDCSEIFPQSSGEFHPSTIVCTYPSTIFRTYGAGGASELRVGIEKTVKSRKCVRLKV